MERTQRVAKLEALLARVQSRSNRGETHGNAAVAMPAAAAAPAPRIAPPVVQAAPPVVQAVSPKPSPVAASAPPIVAEPARPAAPAHETQEEVATVIRDVPPEALAAIATAIAQQKEQEQQQVAAAAPPPAAPPPAAQPQASVAPAFRGTSAFGGLSKKMTLIGTAPPANWPPRGAEASVPPPEPAVAAAPAAAHEDPPTIQEEAPEIQATESEGDLDALLGDSAPPPAEDHATAPMAAMPAPLAAQSSPTGPAKRDALPIVSPNNVPLEKKSSRSAATVVAMILLWLMLIATIWFVYKSSM